jgi:hypothetical protein
MNTEPMNPISCECGCQTFKLENLDDIGLGYVCQGCGYYETFWQEDNSPGVVKMLRFEHIFDQLIEIIGEKVCYEEIPEKIQAMLINSKKPILPDPNPMHWD